VTRVFVCASSSAELGELEAVVKAAPQLKLVGSSLGPIDRASLARRLAETRADVLLEQAGPDSVPQWASADGDAESVPSVVLVDEPEFGPAVAAAQEADSTLRAVLPAWATEAEIQAALEAAAVGLAVFHPDVAGRGRAAGSPEIGAARSPGAAPGQQLSPRESEILNLLAAGLGNKEIAWRLTISEHTVKFHVTSIFNKLGASTRAEAVAIGMRRGLILL
jgi:two-component system, NarL family, response regulator YdfI